MRLVTLRSPSSGIGTIDGTRVLDASDLLGRIATRPEDLVKGGNLAQAQMMLDGESEFKVLGELGEALIAAPVHEPAHMLFIGLNYEDHAREIGVPVPSRPHVFSKLRGSITGPFDSIPLPRGVNQLDYEVELGVIIGDRLRNVPPEAVRDSIAGFVVINDFSARDWQFASDQQLIIGKGFEGFCSVGPALVTPDEVLGIDDAVITCAVNGEIVQDSSTSELVFDIDEIISFLSQVVELQPGDLISTGTPAGVQQGRQDPRWLRPGDVVESYIEGVGTLRNTIVETFAQRNEDT